MSQIYKSLKILCVAATKIELEPLIRLLGNSRRYISAGDFRYRRDALEVDLLVTGIGIIPTIYHTTSQMRSGPYDLVLNVGIAGSFRSDWEPGMVVRVVEEAFGDMGVQKETGYQTMFEAGFWKAHAVPFKKGKLVPLMDKRWLGGLEHLPE